MPKPKPKVESKPVAIEYLPNEYPTVNWRVRRSDWWPDQFEIVTNEKLEQIKSFCTMFGIPMHNIEYNPE